MKTSRKVNINHKQFRSLNAYKFPKSFQNKEKFIGHFETLFQRKRAGRNVRQKAYIVENKYFTHSIFAIGKERENKNTREEKSTETYSAHKVTTKVCVCKNKIVLITRTPPTFRYNDCVRPHKFRRRSMRMYVVDELYFRNSTSL